MVTPQGNTPPKMPFEMLTDQLARLRADVQTLQTQGIQHRHSADRALQTVDATQQALVTALHRLRHRLTAVAGGLTAAMVLCTAAIMWWTKPPATPNYTPAFVALDAVLVDAWKSLPAALQGKLELAYRAGQVRSPAERK